MSKFKVGDTVKLVNHDGAMRSCEVAIPLWSVGVVQISSHLPSYYSVRFWIHDSLWAVTEAELEKVEFKP